MSSTRFSLGNVTYFDSHLRQYCSLDLRNILQGSLNPQYPSYNTTNKQTNKQTKESISFPKPANFLQCMFNENKGLWKGPVLCNSLQIADLYCISNNQSGSPKNWSFPETSFSSSMRSKKLAGSGNEIIRATDTHVLNNDILPSSLSSNQPEIAMVK